MTAGNDFDPGQRSRIVFRAADATPFAEPHRLSGADGVSQRGQFRRGLAFLLMGAWPVFGFFGLDVLAIYWAFRINFRRAEPARKFR
jgi:hypothetical protein